MNTRAFYICTLILGVAFATGLWFLSVSQTKDLKLMELSQAKDLQLIEAQKALIESQQTVIDINEGFVKRLVLQNNEHAQEAADYRNKWLEALE